jgi:predicted dehydrogenase
MTELAFAGAGHITVVHALAARALPELTVGPVASRTPARAAERAAQVGGRAVTYQELPAGADIVVVATPPARHAADALAALDGGAGVILEKPLATTLAEADALVASSAAHGHRLGYAENLAFAPVVMRATSMVRGMGTLRHVDARMLQSRPDWGDFLTESWGGGVLFDLGAHPIALVLLLADAGPGGSDQVVEVRAHLEGADDVPVDVYADVNLTFASGLHARVETSWRDDEAVLDFQAASDDGVMRAELVPHVAIERNGEALALPTLRPEVSDPRLDQFGYVTQLEDFVAAFASGQEPDIGAEFGRLVLEITCAGYASAAAGDRPVALPFTGPRDRTPLQLWRT